MKTYKRLYPQIVAFENLLCAAHLAAKGKREQPNVMRFFHRLEDNLFGLQAELEDRTYRPGAYSTFHIYEPKPRLISAAPFRDRVVHHALINIIGPLFERSFIFDSYANRVGKGTHRAIRRYQHFLRQYQYVLKCDIRKYFPSIDHQILKTLIRWRIADDATLWLIDTIIDGSNPQEPVLAYFPGDDLFTPIERRKGLPIGNLTSQFLANVYLDPFDHFVKEKLRCHAYLRYVDDFALFADHKSVLRAWQEEIAVFLQKYRLTLHPNRCTIFPARTGWRFLGQRVFRTHRLLPSANVRKFKLHLRMWRESPPANRQQRLASWMGHAKQADTYHLLQALGLTCS
ncbi:RNA-directed DNA polymerase [Candidatus Poribacteria bacterium]|nr:RNA-directed DNA polymerase [Candidatus Poribacteria bacterium]